MNNYVRKLKMPRLNHAQKRILLLETGTCVPNGLFTEYHRDKLNYTVNDKCVEMVRLQMCRNVNINLNFNIKVIYI